MLLYWQPPYPAGDFTDYKVDIKPEEADWLSTFYVPREGEPPGPSQGAFNGLIPGKFYNITVETVSEYQLSNPLAAQYRTIPLRPRTLVSLAEWTDAFSVTWQRPDGFSIYLIN